MKRLASSLTKKQRGPISERALMSFWMMLGWISFCLLQRTSCHAVVKRIAYLKGPLALKDQALLSRIWGHWQNHFCNSTVLPSYLHGWSARTKSWSQSQACAGRLVFTAVPDCDIEVAWFFPWGQRYSDAPQGIAIERRAYAKPATAGKVAWDLQ